MNISQVVKNVATNYGRMVVMLVTSLIMTPFLIHKLGTDAFGLWGLSQAIAGYFSLIDFGITSAACRYIAHFRAQKDWTSLNEVVHSSFLCYLLMAVVVLLLCAVIAPMSSMLFPKSELHLQLRYLIWIVGLIAAVGFVSVIPLQCTIAAQRQDLLNHWMLGFQVASAIATFVFVGMGKGVIVLAMVQLANAIFNGLIGYVLMRRLIPEVTLRPKWHKSKGRMILAFAGWSLVISVAFRLIYFSDTLVVGSIVSVSAVAAYMVVLKIIDLMRSFVCPGAAALGVFVSEQAALGGEEVLGAMWVSGSKWSLAIMLPVWCACMLLPAQLIDSWVGSVFDGSQYALMWLASSAIIDLTQSTGYQILMNSGRHKPLAISLAGEAAANLVLSILLCKHMGIVGVAIGTFIPCTVRCCLFYPIYMSRLTGLDLRSYLRRAIWPAVVMSVPTCLLILSYALFHLHSGRTSMLTLIGVCAFSFGTSVLFLGADANQRARILNFLKRKGQLPAAGATKELSEAKELAATR